MDIIDIVGEILGILGILVLYASYQKVGIEGVPFIIISIILIFGSGLIIGANNLSTKDAI